MNTNLLKRIFRPRNMSRSIRLGLAAAGFIVATQVRGSDVIFGNFDPITGLGLSSQNAAGIEWVGTSQLKQGVAFTTDNNLYNVDSVVLDLSHILGNVNDLIVSLHSDAGGMPGGSLGTFSNPASIGQGPALFTATGIVLAPDTTYWVVGEPSGSATVDFEWWYSLTPSPWVASGFDSNANAWNPWTAYTDNTPSLVVYATPVPEPSTLLLAGSGAAAVLVFGRRKRRSQPSGNSI